MNRVEASAIVQQPSLADEAKQMEFEEPEISQEEKVYEMITAKIAKGEIDFPSEKMHFKATAEDTEVKGYHFPLFNHYYPENSKQLYRVVEEHKNRSYLHIIDNRYGEPKNSKQPYRVAEEHKNWSHFYFIDADNKREAVIDLKLSSLSSKV